ncbi:MAG: TatD family hydrolase, partial [Deferribacteraceae bacterium]|nr:TatD family hydrolase [Deferribacteraceae bacterium]
STADLLTRAHAQHIERFITIGISAADSREAVKMAERHADVYAAVGVHPHDAAEFDYKELGLLEELASHKKVLAIGEVGLDFYRNISPKATQIEVFSTMIDLAIASALPIIIHCREAAVDTVAVLENMLGKADHQILFHCFSGEQSLVDWGLARQNVMFSFAGNVTYPKATQLHAALAQLPLERLFIETDCPYLAPVPLRGKQNEPAYVTHTADYVALAKAISRQMLEEQLELNFRAFFKKL